MSTQSKLPIGENPASTKKDADIKFFNLSLEARNKIYHALLVPGGTKILAVEAPNSLKAVNNLLAFSEQVRVEVTALIASEIKARVQAGLYHDLTLAPHTIAVGIPIKQKKKAKKGKKKQDTDTTTFPPELKVWKMDIVVFNAEMEVRVIAKLDFKRKTLNMRFPGLEDGMSIFSSNYCEYFYEIFEEAFMKVMKLFTAKKSFDGLLLKDVPEFLHKVEMPCPKHFWDNDELFGMDYCDEWDDSDDYDDYEEYDDDGFYESGGDPFSNEEDDSDNVDSGEEGEGGEENVQSRECVDKVDPLSRLLDTSQQIRFETHELVSTLNVKIMVSPCERDSNLRPWSTFFDSFRVRKRHRRIIPPPDWATFNSKVPYDLKLGKVILAIVARSSKDKLAAQIDIRSKTVHVLDCQDTLSEEEQSFLEFLLGPMDKVTAEDMQVLHSSFADGIQKLLNDTGLSGVTLKHIRPLLMALESSTQAASGVLLRFSVRRLARDL
ncbi:hypothetical protein E4T42_03114 [Aureobasidium subglaciale]|nr:hypothetical protein E4T42_03114 [Aureobasidium subglaciale]